MKQTYCRYSTIVCSDLSTNTHICTFHFHFALKPRTEHSFTVLMRQRIKRQTEGPLCSPSPPQRALSGGWKAAWGGVDGRRAETTDKTDKETAVRSLKQRRWQFCDEETFPRDFERRRCELMQWHHWLIWHSHTFNQWFMLIRTYWSVRHIHRHCY